MSLALPRNEADVPFLRIVPADWLIPHEEFDVQRSEPLVARLREERLLRNPPTVAEIEGDTRYVILDGTNRAMAVSLLSCPHIIVQVVDYEDPELILDTWFHLVTGMSPVDFLPVLQTFDGLRLEPTNLLHARAELARRQATAYIVMPPEGNSHAPVYLIYADGDLHHRTALLNRLVNVYLKRGRINRSKTDHIEQLIPYYQDIMALVVFPRYEPSEIVELARQGAYLPPGITRHIIPGRALHVNFPLDVLASNRSLDEKNAWLHDWTRQKLLNKEIRYYQESTYLFDE